MFLSGFPGVTLFVAMYMSIYALGYVSIPTRGGEGANKIIRNSSNLTMPFNPVPFTEHLRGTHVQTPLCETHKAPTGYRDE